MMEASALYRKHAISTSERGSLIGPRKQPTAWQLASASIEAPLANGERTAPRRCSLNSTYDKNCGFNRAHLLRLMKVLGEMNNSTLKIRRGKSYLLNFSKSVFHAFLLKLFYAFVTCLLSQVVPFASKPSAVLYTLKSPNHCFPNGICTHQMGLQDSLPSLGSQMCPPACVPLVTTAMTSINQKLGF